MNRCSENRDDVYTRITNAIVSQLERGVRPWIKPWSTDRAAWRFTRPLRHTGVPYSGINVLSLWASASGRGYAAPIWMTYRQALELGGQVRKGEAGTPVVYANVMTKVDTDRASGDELERAIRFLKGYTVFNVEQIDGLPERFSRVESQCLPHERIDRAERFFAATGAVIIHGGAHAFYQPAADRIVMPPIDAFRSIDGYYATLAHELTHWTSHPSRLARDFGASRFGSKGYAMEELVAELGSAFVCADLDIVNVMAPDGNDPHVAHLQQHASYIASWLKVLTTDSRAVFTAASYAQRAAEAISKAQPSYLLN